MERYTWAFLGAVKRIVLIFLWLTGNLYSSFHELILDA